MPKKSRTRQRGRYRLASGVASTPGQERDAAGTRAEERRARKEQARREREQRVRRVRRRRLLRRVGKWAAVLVVLGAVAAFVYVQGAAERRVRAEAAALAERLGCTGVDDTPDEGADHLAPGQPMPEYATRPAASGPHAGAPLPPDPAVYEQPIPEPQSIHNLEHGYVLIHYREEGEGALPGEVVSELADLAEDEAKVIMARYPDLEPDSSLALVGWTKLQQCPRVTDPDDAVTLARAFLSEGASEAPEPGAP
ncbi:MAG: DUF3105 domain-containing protein [Actinomycetota bacterium]